MPAEPKMYKIQEGDTLSDLFGQNWQEVAAFNGIEDPTKLQIGQEINVNLYEPPVKQTPAPQEMNTSVSGEQGFLKGAADWATGYFEDFTAGAESFGDDVFSSFGNSPMPETLEELGSPEELAAMGDIGTLEDYKDVTVGDWAEETPVVDPFRAIAAAGISAALPKVGTGGSDIYKNMLETKGAQYGLDTPDSVRRFLATIKEETGGKGFAASENLNYSVKALLKTFRNARNNEEEAKRIGYTDTQDADQKAIANLVYADRNGNGDTASGDGWKFRGMGSIQLTGRDNYRAVGELMGLTADELADKRDDKAVQLEAAMAYWKLNNLGEDITMDKTTDIVNKHTASRAARQKTYDDLGNVFNP
tara:strand:+ start:498 stop:1583 length:1086 start_codon:yes stop_codon:yes gene_type:complete